MVRLVRESVRPYRSSLTVILLAILVQTMMSLAGPWPLKVIIDNVAGGHKLEPWIANLLKFLLTTGSKMQIALGAATASVVIALFSALASYVANYYTTSVGQYVVAVSYLSTKKCPTWEQLFMGLNASCRSRSESTVRSDSRSPGKDL